VVQLSKALPCDEARQHGARRLAVQGRRCALLLLLLLLMLLLLLL
jgi:hypothetical protein